MIQRDFIQRMIEQLAEVMAKALHLPLLEAREVLSEACQQYTELSLAELYALPTDQLLDKLTQARQLDWTRIEFLGHLLSKDGDYLLQANEIETARVARAHALICLEYADRESGVYDADRLRTLGALREALN